MRGVPGVVDGLIFVEPGSGTDTHVIREYSYQMHNFFIPEM